MAKSDISDFYVDDDLEDVFHRQLKSLDLENNATTHSDVVGDHLPEWLIGVIVVVIMLIIAFFAMVVTSIHKKRNGPKPESSPGPGCDDLESGAISPQGNGETLQVTSFVYNTDITQPEQNTDSVCPSGGTKTLGQDDNDELNCYRNPLFVEEDESSSNENSDPEKTQIRHDPDLVFSVPEDAYSITPCYSGNSLSSASDPTKSLDSHEGGNSPESRVSKGSVHKQKSSSRSADTGRKILTKVVVENSQDFDLERVGKQKRKYAQKSKGSSQSNGTKRGRSNSVTSSADDSQEMNKTQENQEPDRSLSPGKTQGDSAHQSTISTYVKRCSDSGVETSPGLLGDVAENQTHTEGDDTRHELAQNFPIHTTTVGDLHGDDQTPDSVGTATSGCFNSSIHADAEKAVSALAMVASTSPEIQQNGVSSSTMSLDQDISDTCSGSVRRAADTGLSPGSHPNQRNCGPGIGGDTPVAADQSGPGLASHPDQDSSSLQNVTKHTGFALPESFPSPPSSDGSGTFTPMASQGPTGANNFSQAHLTNGCSPATKNEFGRGTADNDDVIDRSVEINYSTNL